MLLRPGDTVAVEDPVYPGLKNLLAGTGAQLAGIPVGADGIDLAQLERVLDRERPRFWWSPRISRIRPAPPCRLPDAARCSQAARAAGVPVIENDTYGDLRYSGEPLPAIKQLDEDGDTILLRSFSKVSFPGLRVGWVIGPQPLIARLRQAKQSSDLHTDQLSQAVLLRFAESGRLEAHRQTSAESRRRTAGGRAGRLPRVSARRARRFTRPEGGMNLWVRLPEPLDAGELLARAQREGVTYLPGRYFAVSRPDPGALRLSFAGLPPEEIRSGHRNSGEDFFGGDWRDARDGNLEPAPAMV